jgi:hypothetical protein
LFESIAAGNEATVVTKAIAIIANDNASSTNEKPARA